MRRSHALAARRAGDIDEAWAALVDLAAGVPPGLSHEEQGAVRRALDEAWAQVLGLLVPSAAGLTGSSRTGRSVDGRVTRTLSEIDRRYADPRLRLQVLARQLAVSPSHLTHLLKSATGRTFGAHVHERRIAEARTLLADSTLSVKEVASRVGYGTTTQLDRHFKKRVRRLPSEYRGLMRGPREESVGPKSARRRGATTTQSMTQPQK